LSNQESKQFWHQYYGQAPDPALNLPYAILLKRPNPYKAPSVPAFNTLPVAQLIRGFQALQPVDPSSPVTSGQPYATSPTAGDKVTFAVKVHDLSLVDSGRVPVYFYAVPVDDGDLNVRREPRLIGHATSAPIPAQGMVTVKSPEWTADANGKSIQQWRIFVVLDPDDKLGEIHPRKGGAPCPKTALDPDAPAGTIKDGVMTDPMTGKPSTLACGQNNQGYGLITVLGRGGQGGADGARTRSLARRFGPIPASTQGAVVGATGPAEPARCASTGHACSTAIRRMRTRWASLHRSAPIIRCWGSFTRARRPRPPRTSRCWCTTGLRPRGA